MNKNVFVVLLMAAAGGLAVVVMYQRAMLAELQADLQRLGRQRVAMVKPAKAAPPAAQRRTPPPPPVPRGEKTPARHARPPDRPAAPPDADAAGNPLAGLADMLKNPQMMTVVRAQQQLVLHQMYGALPRYVTLTPEQHAALTNLLFARQMAVAEAGLAAMSGSAAERQEALAEGRIIKEQYDEQIKDLLGPQDYQTFQDYEKTAGDRVLTQMFKGTLPADATLTDQQEYDLLAAMYEERQGLPGLPAPGGQPPDPSQLTDEAIARTLKQQELLRQKYAERAKAILTPTQYDAFVTWQQQMGVMQAEGLKTAQQMYGIKSASALSGVPGQP